MGTSSDKVSPTSKCTDAAHLEVALAVHHRNPMQRDHAQWIPRHQLDLERASLPHIDAAIDAAANLKHFGVVGRHRSERPLGSHLDKVGE